MVLVLLSTLLLQWPLLCDFTSVKITGLRFNCVRLVFALVFVIVIVIVIFIVIVIVIVITIDQITGLGFNCVRLVFALDTIFMDPVVKVS